MSPSTIARVMHALEAAMSFGGIVLEPEQIDDPTIAALDASLCLIGCNEDAMDDGYPPAIAA